MTEARPQWYEDKVTGRVTNVSRPGDDIYINVNGFALQIQDGATVTIPKAHVLALRNAVNVDWKVVPGQPAVQVSKPRFIFHEVQNITVDATTQEIVDTIISENEAARPSREGGKKPKRGVIVEDAVVADGQHIDVRIAGE